jgi:hypothetical protein
MASGEATYDDFGYFEESGLHAGYGDETYGGNFNTVVISTIGPTNTEGASFILERDDGQQIALDYDSEDNGWYVGRYDMGVPVARQVVSDRPSMDGTDNRTRHVGGRNVILGLTLAGANRQAMLDSLAPFMDPGQVVTLIAKTERWDAYRRLRVKPVSGPDATWDNPGLLAVTVGFQSVGSPFFTGELHQSTAFPTDTLPGRTYPRSYPRAYPTSAGTGPALLYNQGSRAAEWTARIFGPAYGPRLIHAGSGRQVVFDDALHIESGDYLTVDSTDRTALLNGLTDASRYEFLDFAETDSGWFKLEPGQNLMRFVGAAGTIAPAQAEITFRDTYL